MARNLARTFGLGSQNEELGLGELGLGYVLELCGGTRLVEPGWPASAIVTAPFESCGRGLRRGGVEEGRGWYTYRGCNRTFAAAKYASLMKTQHSQET